MQDGRIKADQITASSYAASAQPHEGRMGGKAWIPHGNLAYVHEKVSNEVKSLRKNNVLRSILEYSSISIIRTFLLLRHFYYPALIFHEY